MNEYFESMTEQPLFDMSQKIPRKLHASYAIKREVLLAYDYSMFSSCNNQYRFMQHFIGKYGVEAAELQPIFSRGIVMNYLVNLMRG